MIHKDNYDDSNSNKDKDKDKDDNYSGLRYNRKKYLEFLEEYKKRLEKLVDDNDNNDKDKGKDDALRDP